MPEIQVKTIIFAKGCCVTKNSGKMGTAPSSNVMGCQQQYNNSTPQPILYRLCSMKPISYINSRGQPSHFP